jgi:hypothetical protein
MPAMRATSLAWRNDAVGQAGLALPESDTEIVLSTVQRHEENWLVRSADDAAHAVERAGGSMIVGPHDIPVGRLVVVADPFDNVLVLLDLSKGRYATDDAGNVTGVSAEAGTVAPSIQEPEPVADGGEGHMTARSHRADDGCGRLT